MQPLPFVDSVCLSILSITPSYSVSGDNPVFYINIPTLHSAALSWPYFPWPGLFSSWEFLMWVLIFYIFLMLLCLFSPLGCRGKECTLLAWCYGRSMGMSKSLNRSEPQLCSVCVCWFCGARITPVTRAIVGVK